MKRAKKNCITLEQWALEHQTSLPEALAQLQTGSLKLKTFEDKDQVVWVATNQQSLESWALENSFAYDDVLHWYQNEILPVKVTQDKNKNLWVTNENIVRAIPLSLKYLTTFKRGKINHLIEAYRGAVNFYINTFWETKAKLDKNSLASLTQTRLTERYKSQALKQALETIVNTKKAAKELEVAASKPVFKGFPKLDAKFIKIEDSRHLKNFDICITLATLKRRHQIVLPTKGTEVLRKWLAQGQLLQSCELRDASIIVFVELPTESYKAEGSISSLDLGRNKLIAMASTQHPTQTVEVEKRGWKKILDKINRRQPGSQSRKRAYRHRENYLNQTLNLLPWKDLRFLGMEDLRGIKKGKKENQSKQLRKMLASWNQARVRERVNHKSQENRVFLVSYNPFNTSRECPNCKKALAANRQGEFFVCQFCAYQDDADFVGAENGLVQTCRLLGSLESPKNKSIKESSELKSEESGSS